jgi:hypothetical protein
MTSPVRLHTRESEATSREPVALSQHVGSKFSGHDHDLQMHFGPLSVSSHTGLVAVRSTVAQGGPHSLLASARAPPFERRQPPQPDANARDFEIRRPSVFEQQPTSTGRGARRR